VAITVEVLHDIVPRDIQSASSCQVSDLPCQLEELYGKGVGYFHERRSGLKSYSHFLNPIL
jgi:hypothetical protein